MNLVRRFIDQIGFVLDARVILIFGGIEIGGFIHVEPYSIVFSNLAIFVETLFPPLSDVWGGPIWEYRGSMHEYKCVSFIREADDSPRPDCANKLFSAWVFEEDVLLVTAGIDLVRVLRVLFIRHTDSSIDQRDIMLLVLVKLIDKCPILCLATR